MSVPPKFACGEDLQQFSLFYVLQRCSDLSDEGQSENTCSIKM
jgi:hypothetical protein